MRYPPPGSEGSESLPGQQTPAGLRPANLPGLPMLPPPPGQGPASSPPTGGRAHRPPPACRRESEPPALPPPDHTVFPPPGRCLPEAGPQPFPTEGAQRPGQAPPPAERHTTGPPLFFLVFSWKLSPFSKYVHLRHFTLSSLTASTVPASFSCGNFWACPPFFVTKLYLFVTVFR